jgi:hypothetical protein
VPEDEHVDVTHTVAARGEWENGVAP